MTSTNKQQKNQLKKLIKQSEDTIKLEVDNIISYHIKLKQCDYNIMVNKDNNRKSQRLLKGRYVTIKNNNMYDFYEVVNIFGDKCELQLLPKVSYNDKGKNMFYTKQKVKDNIKNREPFEVISEIIFNKNKKEN